jgi:hypothetical protein
MGFFQGFLRGKQKVLSKSPKRFSYLKEDYITTHESLDLPAGLAAPLEGALLADLAEALIVNFVSEPVFVKTVRTHPSLFSSIK